MRLVASAFTVAMADGLSGKVYESAYVASSIDIDEAGIRGRDRRGKVAEITSRALGQFWRRLGGEE